MTLRIGYILRSYPRLSQTFVANEILALEQLGVQIVIFAITQPHEPIVQAQVAQIRAPVHYLEISGRRSWWDNLIEHCGVALAAPLGYLWAWWYVWRHPEIDAGYTASSRYECLRQAIHLAHLIRHHYHDENTLTQLHAHFAHDPTLIAQLVQRLTGLPYSFTAHARDIFQISPALLAARIQDACAVVTGCLPFLDYLKQVTPTGQRHKLHVIHHGTDLQEFQPDPQRQATAAEPLILSASRLVEKKGYPDLLQACQRLKAAGHRFRCVIYGDGPQEKELATLIEQLALHDVVALAGVCSQQELRRHIQAADIFALTPFVTDDKDIDGVPMVLVEAMACAVPVVSTAVGGIPELVQHEQNGLLAPPHDVNSVATALATLLENASKRQQLGRAARMYVQQQFDLRAEAQQLTTLFMTLTMGSV